MAYEYKILAVTTIFYLFAWFPSSVGKYHSYGWKWLSSNRNPVAGRELLPWAGRAERAYANLKDYFPAFIAAILLLGINDKFDGATSCAATIYLGARLLHLVAYIYGNVSIRFLGFLAGIVSNTFLLIKIFL